jgi:hypothetical protein
MSPFNHKRTDHKLVRFIYILCTKKIGNKKPLEKVTNFHNRNEDLLHFVFKMTNSLSRLVQQHGTSDNNHLQESCSQKLNLAFDDCIEVEVSSRLSDMYKCRNPNFPVGNMTIPECKLHEFSAEELSNYRDKYLG